MSVATTTSSQLKDTLQKMKKAFKKGYLPLFAGVVLFVWSWMLVYTFINYQPQYASRSLVMIKDSAITSRYVIPDNNYALQTTTSSSANPVLNTMGLLKSESISNDLYDYLKSKQPEALKKMGINNKTQWESFFGDGKSIIKAKNEPGTDLIRIQFTWDDPKVAQEGLAITMDAFSKASLNLNRSEQENRSRYLSEQVQNLETRLEEIRKDKSVYKSKMRITNLNREGDELVATSIALANSLSTLDASARGKEAEYLRYQNMLNLSPEEALEASALGMNATLSKLQDQLYVLSQTHAQLKTTLTEKNPKLKEIRSQMEQVEEDIKSEMIRTLGKAPAKEDGYAVSDSTRSTVINQMVAAQAEFIRLSTEAQVVRDRIAEVDSKIQQLPNLEQELNALEDEERSLSSSLATLRQKELEAKMKQAETLSNVFVVDPPSLPSKAKFPRQPHLIFMGFFLGLAAGAMSVYVRIQLTDAKLRSLWNNFAGEKKLRPIGLRPFRQELPQPEVENYEDPDAFLDELFSRNVHQMHALKMKLLKHRLYHAMLASNHAQFQQFTNNAQTIKEAAYAK